MPASVFIPVIGWVKDDQYLCDFISVILPAMGNMGFKYKAVPWFQIVFILINLVMYASRQTVNKFMPGMNNLSIPASFSRSHCYNKSLDSIAGQIFAEVFHAD